jgi:hypothetical protein
MHDAGFRAFHNVHGVALVAAACYRKYAFASRSFIGAQGTVGSVGWR